MVVEMELNWLEGVLIWGMMGGNRVEVCSRSVDTYANLSCFFGEIIQWMGLKRVWGEPGGGWRG